jgi:hypothetical protein
MLSQGFEIVGQQDLRIDIAEKEHISLQERELFYVC